LSVALIAFVDVCAHFIIVKHAFCVQSYCFFLKNQSFLIKILNNLSKIGKKPFKLQMLLHNNSSDQLFSP